MAENEKSWLEYRLHVMEGLKDIKKETKELKEEFQALVLQFNVFKAKVILIGTFVGASGALAVELIINFVIK